MKKRYGVTTKQYDRGETIQKDAFSYLSLQILVVLLLVGAVTLDQFQICPRREVFVLVLLRIRLLPLVSSLFSSLCHSLSSTLPLRCNTHRLQTAQSAVGCITERMERLKRNGFERFSSGSNYDFVLDFAFYVPAYLWLLPRHVSCLCIPPSWNFFSLSPFFLSASL